MYKYNPKFPYVSYSYIPIIIPATKTNMPPQPTLIMDAPPVFNELTVAPVVALELVLVSVLVLVFVPLTIVVLVSVLVEAPVLVADKSVWLGDDGDGVTVLEEEMAKRPE